MIYNSLIPSFGGNGINKMQRNGLTNDKSISQTSDLTWHFGSAIDYPHSKGCGRFIEKSTCSIDCLEVSGQIRSINFLSAFGKLKGESTYEGKHKKVIYNSKQCVSFVMRRTSVNSCNVAYSEGVVYKGK